MSDSPFAHAAPYYHRYRPHYAPKALDFLVEAFALDGEARVLDLGCGPGTLAIPLSRRVAGVVAVDPDAGMLAEGQRLARKARQDNIVWIQARAEDISQALGSFRAVVMGQSFHWMERALVLDRIGDLIEEGGGLALVNPGRRRPQESWEAAAYEVVARYLGPPVRHPGSNPQEPSHEPALLRSRCFSQFCVREFSSQMERDAQSILGHLYSMSFAAKPLFGDQAADFEHDLFEVLARINPSGRFMENVETEVLIAPKLPAP